MKVIATINYKGGVGKTIITSNIAATLAMRGYRVLLIDLDPQASLTFSFLSVDEWQNNYESDRTIKNWYDAFIYNHTIEDLEELIIEPERVTNELNTFPSSGELKLICSNLKLINVDLELATMLGGANLKMVGMHFLDVHSHLRRGLKELNNSGFDFCIIDCPPNFNITTKNAIVASDYILVPAIPDYLSTIGMYELKTHTEELLREYNTYFREVDSKYKLGTISPKWIGVVFNMLRYFDNRPIQAFKEYVEKVKDSPIPTFKSMIRRADSIIPEGVNNKVPIVLHKRNDSPFLTIKNEFNNLSNELLERINE